MTTPEDEAEGIIEAAIRRHSPVDAAALMRAILESLWDAGYEVTRRPDMIPIVHNPGEEVRGSESHARHAVPAAREQAAQCADRRQDRRDCQALASG